MFLCLSCLSYFENDCDFLNAISDTWFNVTIILFHVLQNKLLNASVNTGIFPNELKIAKVIPIYKAKATNMFSNYWPISILQFLSKLLESQMYNRLLNLLINMTSYTNISLVFEKNHSTSMALMDTVDKISEALKNAVFRLVESIRYCRP